MCDDKGFEVWHCTWWTSATQPAQNMKAAQQAPAQTAHICTSYEVCTCCEMYIVWKDFCVFHYSLIRCTVKETNKKRRLSIFLASKCATGREHGLEMGFDLSGREGRSCHIVAMIPRVLCSASVDMDLTGLNMAVKQGPATAARWTASSCHR